MLEMLLVRVSTVEVRWPVEIYPADPRPWVRPVTDDMRSEE
jgi:hypothetical protein